MMRKYNLHQLGEKELQSLLQRPADNLPDLENVRSIVEDVRKNGDAALFAYSQKFDGVTLEQFEIPEPEFISAESEVHSDLKRAIRKAAANIKAFHRLQIPNNTVLETAPGVLCRREWRAIERAGLYVPGGSAPLFSTVLMLGIPARIAGCRNIVLCTPPSKGGGVAPEILFAAKVAGVNRVFRVGGAQAIAAMAFGTESVSRVDKIFGPGNRFVSAAKLLVSQPPARVAIDMMAGPSELLLIADNTANPRWIAADLLAQAEHGADSQVVLISTSSSLIDAVDAELQLQQEKLPRQTIARKAIENSFAVLANSIRESIEFSNRYGPEHLMLAIDDAESHVPEVQSAGSVFLGTWSSVVFGDYASGTNHTLPTSGTARAVGGLTVESFMKSMTIQSLSAQGFNSLAPTVELLAMNEGLHAHAGAVAIRKNVQSISTQPHDVNPERWIRPHLRSFEPYSSARNEASAGEVFLDANELTCSSPIRMEGIALNRYPDPAQTALRERLAAMLKVKPGSVFAGNGSDEIIDLLLRLFCEPGRDSIAIFEPTYGVYRVAANALGVFTNSVELDCDFQIESGSITADSRILFCCSPNNPTGNLLRREDILQLCSQVDGLVVVDEAYIEFASGPSFASEVQSHPNLIVLRTLSKAWGLAGIRLGYCIADSQIVEHLLRIKAPYNISACSQRIALQALEEPRFVEQSRRTILRERERLSRSLAGLTCVERVYPSEANFLLVRFYNAERAFSALMENGIVVRRRSEPRLKNCLRITIGTTEENGRVIGVLEQIHEESRLCRS